MGRIEKMKRLIIEESNKRILNEETEKVGVGGLMINGANIEKVGDSVKITFNNNNIPKDVRFDYGIRFIWDCTITLMRKGDMIDGIIQCTGEGKYQGKDVERAIMTIVDDFPKPVDTNNFSQKIIDLF